MNIEKMQEEALRKEQKVKAQCSGKFLDFMDNPLVRVTISSMPPEVAKSDALNLLLSAAFENGFQYGACAAVEEMTATIVKALKEDK